jgi:hypothetical protein
MIVRYSVQILILAWVKNVKIVREKWLLWDFLRLLKTIKDIIKGHYRTSETLYTMATTVNKAIMDTNTVI